MRDRKRLAGLVAAALALSAACRDSLQVVPVARVELSRDSARLIVGDTLVLRAVPRSAAGTALVDRPVTWSSDHPQVARILAAVSDSAWVLANGLGLARVIAESDGMDDTATITVRAVPVESVSIAPSVIRLGPGDSVQLAATPYDSQGRVLAGRDVTWHSSDLAVAWVGVGGRVRAGADGVAQITAVVDSVVSPPAVVTVGSAHVGAVAVTPASASLLVGDVMLLTAEVRDDSNRVLPNYTVTWASADPSVATVAFTGLVTGVSPGATTITAAAGGHSGQAVIAVSPPGPASDFGGVWDWTERFDDVNGTVCSDTGSYTIVQVGATVRGLSEQVGTCVGPGGSTPNNPTDSVRSGLVTGRSITFFVGANNQCTYTGTLSATSNDSLSGTATCPGSSGSTAPGTWRAARGPLGSVTVTPPTVHPLNGTSTYLVAQLWTPSGDRAFGRPVTWSSDDANIAVVTPSGAYGATASAFSVGSVRVTASAGGVSGFATVTVPPPVAFVASSMGRSSACGLAANGDAYCWGSNNSGQLGNGTDLASAVPTAVVGGLLFAAVGVGDDFACGLTTAGAAYCWGSDGSGRLGDGMAAFTQETPVPVQGGLTFTALSVGGAHACGLSSAGAAYCWGLNDHGQVGDGSTTSQLTPVPVQGGLAFTSISAGQAHTCGLTLMGVAYCWGDNGYGGKLGDGTTLPRPLPVPVQGGLTFAVISAGQEHTCGVTTGGAAFCWGDNDYGQLGNGTGMPSTVPFPVSGGRTWVDIVAGFGHSCGVATGGAAFCWGLGESGELGSGNFASYGTPEPVVGGLTFVSLSAGGWLDVECDYYYGCYDVYLGHTSGVTTGGLTYTWGNNSFGQLGTGSAAWSATPAKVAGQP
jgi:alpha-tubulin suppressor-like RCC1 family protein/uncharacterized protein YjdB